MKTLAKTTLALVLVAFATGALAVDGGNPKKGRHLYKKHCIACHPGPSELDVVPLRRWGGLGPLFSAVSYNC
ncbi:hypothetical protein [Ferrimonas pelagia]|uniref:Cytochrome c n=1 Tax=Ferrimonas pelagia TaxID=1177826 RepID=A0ABP9ESI9_9GAMM